MEETIAVLVDPNNISRMTLVDNPLPKEEKQELIEFLKKNLDSRRHGWSGLNRISAQAECENKCEANQTKAKTFRTEKEQNHKRDRSFVG